MVPVEARAQRRVFLSELPVASCRCSQGPPVTLLLGQDDSRGWGQRQGLSPLGETSGGDIQAQATVVDLWFWLRLSHRPEFAISSANQCPNHVGPPFVMKR